MTGARNDSTATPKRPTLYDVARLAGVSHQTVSRVVKGHTNVGPDIRQRIEVAIQELDYRPNLLARSLATRRSHRIGALVYEFHQTGPSRIIQGASSAAREAGYLLDIVALAPNDDRAIEQAISLLDQNELAGILVFAPTDPVLRILDTTHFTVPVYIEVEANERSNATRPTPNDLGARLVVDHLADLGHRDFLHVTGPAGWPAARGRMRGYDEAVARRGLRSAGVLIGDWSPGSGYELVAGADLDDVTALVMGNDQMALGAIAALHARGLRVPEDLSVVGFDDIPESHYFLPSLTTVRLDFQRQGRIAIGRLLQQIDGIEDDSDDEVLLPELFARASSAPPR